jgi:SAM-dependent methyltransferase
MIGCQMKTPTSSADMLLPFFSPVRDDVDPYVQRWVAGTNGNLYKPVVDKLRRYPIPKWPGPPAPGSGARMLDIGCGWGRWMVSAARAGFYPVGIDVREEALAAANRVLKVHGHAGQALAGELSSLPLPDEHFDLVFSYSVLQHAPKTRVVSCLREIRRVLKPGGYCIVELPLTPGLTNWRHKSSVSEDPGCWDVRYYRWREIVDVFQSLFEAVTIKVDCILGIGVKFEDLDILPVRYKPIAILSEAFRRLAEFVPALVTLSDSVYVCARKQRP